MNKPIIGIDPSGNFEEGKGTTGFCVLESGTTNIPIIGEISANDYENIYDYWNEHLFHIEPYMTVSMEDYLLYADKSDAQINSKFETVQLIGVIKHYCWQHDIPLYIRNAGQVKRRWANNILAHKGYITKCGRGWAATTHPDRKLSRHELDAIRHAVHYDILERKKEE